MSANTVDVRELRVGMYIHLDVGWMSHPFPLSSFKISSKEQIGTIQQLGLRSVRWVPEKSDPPHELPAPGQGARGAGPSAAEIEAQKKAQREALQAQRAAQAVCERQYGEAAKAWRDLSDSVDADPDGARERAEALTRALLDKMLGQQELCIRLLTEGAGDKATAHALNVTIVSLLMGRVFGFSEAEMTDLGMGAMLHDIGKQQLPGRLHYPDEKFTSVEHALYREHVAHGVALGRKMALAPGALLVIAQHHEQADGSGFPQQLQVERMSNAARIVALVNRYDNMCNPSVLSKTLTPHEALSLLFAQGKQKFDVTMLNGFIRMMGVYPPGSIVQLTDDRYGMVVSVNSSRPLKPRVLVHDPKVAREEALYCDLETTPELGIRRSLKPAQLPPAALEYLAPGRRIAYFFEPVAPAAPEEQRVEEPAT
jgi:putative nucleotidyltransferase with HDIG domain